MERDGSEFACREGLGAATSWRIVDRWESKVGGGDEVEQNGFVASCSSVVQQGGRT